MAGMIFCNCFPSSSQEHSPLHVKNYHIVLTILKYSLFACKRGPNIPGCISTPKTCSAENKGLDHQQQEYEIPLWSFLHFFTKCKHYLTNSTLQN